MRANEFIKEDHGPTLAGEWWEIIKDKLGIGDSNNHQKYLDNFKKQPSKIPPPKRKSLRGRGWGYGRTVVPGMHGTENNRVIRKGRKDSKGRTSTDGERKGRLSNN